nr:xylulose kinase-1 [Tanacetum cinerariifolium]
NGLYIRYALTANPTIYASVVRQFWGSGSEVSLPDGVKGHVATIDGTTYTVTKASIRSALQLDDLNAIDTMTNAEILAGLRDIGSYMTRSEELLTLLQLKTIINIQRVRHLFLLLDSPPKDTSLPLDPETEEQDVPLRKSSRKKSIARRRTLPSPSKLDLDAEQVYLDSLLSQRVAEEQERESMASAAQSTQRQAKLDRVALNLTNEEWIGLVDQVWANLTLSAELLGADVSEDTFSVRMVDLMNKRRKAIAEMKAKAKREKPMTPAQQKEFMRTFVKNQSSAIYTTGWTWKDVRGLTDDQLQIVYDKIRRAVDLATAKDHHQHLKRSGETLESSKHLFLLLDSPPKDTSLPLDPETEEQDVPLRKSSRKKSIARRRTLPSPSKLESAVLPFDEDDPEAEFKKYLRQVSDDDEPAEPVSLALVSDIR